MKQTIPVIEAESFPSPQHADHSHTVLSRSTSGLIQPGPGRPASSHYASPPPRLAKHAILDPLRRSLDEVSSLPLHYALCPGR